MFHHPPSPSLARALRTGALLALAVTALAAAGTAGCTAGCSQAKSAPAESSGPVVAPGGPAAAASTERAGHEHGGHEATPASSAAVAMTKGTEASAALVDPSAPTDPMARHFTETDKLLELFPLKSFSDAEWKRRRPDAFLRGHFGDGPGRINDGNPALARHRISKAQCLAGLRDIPLQTPEQKEICGADYMVPVYEGGDKSKARYCIDVFEFPNKPCELPVVWVAPSVAATVCAYQGKRLCAQEEWNLACRADPAGGPDWTYAYGSDLDLAVCNTERPHEKLATGSFRCNPYTAQSTWSSCATETEPAGAFPRCRSRFGVFDQHGNVAEIMTRMDRDKGLVSQLKGSAFFYVDVARKHDEPPAKNAPRETYPDHCNYDPRWHVEPMSSALHVNYHLGFRCCKSLDPKP